MIFRLVLYSALTFLHYLFLRWVLHNDIDGNWSETTVSIFMIPCGLLNCMLFYQGFSRLRERTKEAFIYVVFTSVNFILYIILSMEMPTLSGSITN